MVGNFSLQGVMLLNLTWYILSLQSYGDYIREYQAHHTQHLPPPMPPMYSSRAPVSLTASVGFPHFFFFLLFLKHTILISKIQPGTSRNSSKALSFFRNQALDDQFKVYFNYFGYWVWVYLVFSSFMSSHPLLD